MTNWSWDNLRFLLAIGMHGTLSEAAKQLNVSHTTVQRRLSMFEKEVNAVLLTKNAHGYGLTAAGEILFQHAKQQQASLEEQIRQISASDSSISGAVTVTSTDTISFFLLPKLIKKLNTQHPQLEIKLSMLNRISDIQNLEADIAIRTCLNPPEQLIGRKVGSLSFAVCATKQYIEQHQITHFPKKSAAYHAIVLDHSYADTPFAKWFKDQLSPSASVTTVNGFLSAWSLCKASLGLTLLPTYLLNGDKDLVQLSSENLPVINDLWILGHSDFRDTERVRTVRQFLYQGLKPLFATDTNQVSQ